MSDQGINQGNPPANSWSHISETVNMLYLAVCQIETTMSEANTSVDTLTESFTHLAGHTRDVASHVQNLTDTRELGEFKQEVTETADEIQVNISKAIQAFQFYDRVCQRVDHVARSLEKVSQLLEDDSHLTHRDSWKSVQEQIKASYTMEAERIMFEYLMRGASVKEALDVYNHHFAHALEDNDGDEVELF